MDYLLDTNIIVIYSRDNKLSEKIEEKYEIFSGDNRLFISVVTLGEIDAFIKKFKLGERRKRNFNKILEGVVSIGLNHRKLISKYGDIDAYSQGKISHEGEKFSSKNMGKNDIWIAATASTFNLKLFTTDKDFNHLSGKYVDLEFIDITQVK